MDAYELLSKVGEIHLNEMSIQLCDCGKGEEELFAEACG